MKQLRVNDQWEFLLVAILLRWEQNAPPDRHWGEFDDRLACNSQQQRLAHVLQKVAIGRVDDVYRTLARYTRRRDGKSYVSMDPSWMKKPMPLCDGWYVEGGQSLGTQKLDLLDNLTKLGYSQEFVECARDFVAGRSVESYLPTFEELEVLFKDCPGASFTRQPEECECPT